MFVACMTRCRVSSERIDGAFVAELEDVIRVQFDMNSQSHTVVVLSNYRTIVMTAVR